jgi:hypothetical protein
MIKVNVFNLGMDDAAGEMPHIFISSGSGSPLEIAANMFVL